MELYIYDRQLGLVDIIDVSTSIRWRRKYFEPGEVEIHLPATVKNLQLLQEDRIIRRTDRTEAAFIEGVKVQGVDLIITGRMLSGMLDRALISRIYTLHDTAGTVMGTLAGEAKRVIPELTVSPSAMGAVIDVQVGWKDVSTCLQKIGRASGVGCRVLYTPQGMTFETYEGLDRSVLQNDRPRVIFSDEFGNFADVEYTRDVRKHKNVAYVRGPEAEDGSYPVVVVVDQSGGEPVREMLVNGGSIRQEEGMSHADYLALMETYGREKLAEKPKVESFEGDIHAVGNFEYLKDWDLGDIVTIHYAHLGLIGHARVTEVEEIYERGTTRILPVFGSPLPEKLELGVD